MIKKVSIARKIVGTALVAGAATIAACGGPAVAESAHTTASTPAPAASPSYTAQANLRIAVAGARVRTGPATSYTVLGLAYPGNTMTANCWADSRDGFMWFHGTVPGVATGFTQVDMFVNADITPAEKVLPHC